MIIDDITRRLDEADREYNSRDKKTINLSLSKRVHAGKAQTACETLVYLASHIALAIATGYFLWHPQESEEKVRNFNNFCNAQYYSLNMGSKLGNFPAGAFLCDESEKVNV